MSDPLEQQTVVEFVLESETNIHTAALMAKAFPQVQREIIVSTLDELESNLRKVIGSEWKIYNCRDEIGVINYPGFTVSRESWGEIYINLEYMWREECAIIGVWRDRKAGEMAALDSALASAFAKAKLTGVPNRYWAWFQSLPPEKGNWAAAPALAGMHFERNKMVDYLTDQILLIKKNASPVIDRFVDAK